MILGVVLEMWLVSVCAVCESCIEPTIQSLVFNKNYLKCIYFRAILFRLTISV